MQTQGLLYWTLPERENCQELTCAGNFLLKAMCGLSLEKKGKPVGVWGEEGMFSTCNSNWRLCREGLMNKSVQTWERASVTSSGADSQLVGIRGIYIGGGLKPLLLSRTQQMNDTPFSLISCLHFVPLINVSSSSLSSDGTSGTLWGVWQYLLD